MARVASKVGGTVAAAVKSKTRAKSKKSLAAASASLTTAHLRLLLSQIGSATSGLKPVMYDRFQQAVQEPLLPMAPIVNGAENAQTQERNRLKKSMRVLSIDMGIRNLAYCVADIRLDTSDTKDKTRIGSNGDRWRLDIVDWKRIDVVPSNTPKKKRSKKKAAEAEEESVAELAKEHEADVFSPAKLAPAAVSLAKNIFLPTNPDLIAIERQRFRTGGQSAVLEWTLRVNMLEGMLWTAFKSIPGTHDVVAVSPARVAKFWVPKVAGERSAIEKAEKVEVVRQWLNGECPTGLTIKANETADATKEVVLSGRVRGVDKVDDLADCLLQAGALVMWERNRRLLSDFEMSHEKLKEYCSTIADDGGDSET